MRVDTRTTPSYSELNYWTFLVSMHYPVETIPPPRIHMCFATSAASAYPSQGFRVRDKYMKHVGNTRAGILPTVLTLFRDSCVLLLSLQCDANLHLVILYSEKETCGVWVCIWYAHMETSFVEADPRELLDSVWVALLRRSAPSWALTSMEQSLSNQNATMSLGRPAWDFLMCAISKTSFWVVSLEASMWLGDTQEW